MLNHPLYQVGFAILKFWLGYFMANHEHTNLSRKIKKSSLEMSNTYFLSLNTCPIMCRMGIHCGKHLLIHNILQLEPRTGSVFCNCEFLGLVSYLELSYESKDVWIGENIHAMHFVIVAVNCIIIKCHKNLNDHEPSLTAAILLGTTHSSLISSDMSLAIT
jgi:hypothetical protein